MLLKIDNYLLTIIHTDRNRTKLHGVTSSMKRTGLFLSTAILAACASSPASVTRMAGGKVAFFAAAPDAPATWAANGVTGTAPQGNWIAQFNDPRMQILIEEALTANPSLEARAAAVRSSAASTRLARSAGRPSLNATASAGGTSNRILSSRVTDPTFGLGLDASWELDLWNRIGSAINEADAELLASEADLEAAELSIAAQTAISWINLNAALAQQRVAVQTYEARNRLSILTERRFQSGLATALDVRTARSELAGAEASIANRQQASGEAARRLELLLGRYPSAELEAPAELPILTEISVMGNPALLLSRRPDIAAQEARIVAAGLRAEQARLAMLPSLRLTASASTTEDNLTDVFDPKQIAARAIASLVQPLFTGGQLDAQRDAAIANAEFAVANYASAVLTAWREVEDALAADTFLARQEDAQLRALDEARFAEELAERSYASGTTTIFDLLNAQTRRLNAESQVIFARTSRATNRISYYLSLGGEGLQTLAVDSAATLSPIIPVILEEEPA
jgi:NodT family efflux transporter outer membrane factor (OMF) lipoprotein